MKHFLLSLLVILIHFAPIFSQNDAPVAVSEDRGYISKVKIDDKFGFKDNVRSVMIIPAEYEDLPKFITSVMAAKKEGKWGLISDKNEIVIPFVYDFITTYTTAYFAEREGLYEFIPINGKPLNNKRYSRLNFLRNDVYEATLDGKSGILDAAGKTIIPHIYDPVMFTLGTDLFIAIKDGKYGCIDKQNNTVIPFEYDFIFSRRDNRTHIRVKRDGKQGFINRKNEVLVPIIYDEVQREWKMDMTLAALDGKFGVLNNKNEPVIPFLYQNIIHKEDKYFLCIIDKNNAGLRDTTGKVLLPDNFQKIIHPRNGLNIYGAVDGKWAMYDLNGKQLTELKYDRIDELYAECRLSDAIIARAHGLLSPEGVEITPFEFTQIIWRRPGYLEMKKGRESTIYTVDGKPLTNLWFESLDFNMQNYSTSFYQEYGAKLLTDIIAVGKLANDNTLLPIGRNGEILNKK